MSNEIKKFLDRDGISHLLENLISKINTKMNSFLTNVTSDTPDYIEVTNNPEDSSHKIINLNTSFIETIEYINNVLKEIDTIEEYPISEFIVDSLELSSDGGTVEIRVTFKTPVEFIEGIPSIGLVNTPVSLDGILIPSNPTVSSPINWTIINDGETNSTINNSELIATNAGTVKLLATIPNGIETGVDYTQYFDIYINNV